VIRDKISNNFPEPTRVQIKQATLFVCPLTVMEEEGGGAYDPAVDVAVGPDGEAMSVAKLLVNLLQGPYNGLYDALLQNLYMHKGVDDLHTDTLLMALRLAPHLEEIIASDG
jgi:hypothetical protein